MEHDNINVKYLINKLTPNTDNSGEVTLTRRKEMKIQLHCAIAGGSVSYIPINWPHSCIRCGINQGITPYQETEEFNVVLSSYQVGDRIYTEGKNYKFPITTYLCDSCKEKSKSTGKKKFSIISLFFAFIMALVIGFYTYLCFLLQDMFVGVDSSDSYMGMGAMFIIFIIIVIVPIIISIVVLLHYHEKWFKRVTRNYYHFNVRIDNRIPINANIRFKSDFFFLELLKQLVPLPYNNLMEQINQTGASIPTPSTERQQVREEKEFGKIPYHNKKLLGAGFGLLLVGIIGYTLLMFAPFFLSVFSFEYFMLNSVLGPIGLASLIISPIFILIWSVKRIKQIKEENGTLKIDKYQTMGTILSSAGVILLFLPVIPLPLFGPTLVILGLGFLFIWRSERKNLKKEDKPPNQPASTRIPNYAISSDLSRGQERTIDASICPSCGKPRNITDEFCQNCGRFLQ